MACKHEFSLFLLMLLCPEEVRLLSEAWVPWAAWTCCPGFNTLCKGEEVVTKSEEPRGSSLRSGTATVSQLLLQALWPVSGSMGLRHSAHGGHLHSVPSDPRASTCQLHSTSLWLVKTRDLYPAEKAPTFATRRVCWVLSVMRVGRDLNLPGPGGRAQAQTC